MSFGIISFLRSLSAGRGAVPVADDNPLPVYMTAAANIGTGVGFETVTFGQTDQVMGGAGAVGDYLDQIVASVVTAAAANVSIKDGAGSAITVIPAGSAIGPYTVKIGARSMAGAWSVTTGAGVSVLATGRFT